MCLFPLLCLPVALFGCGGGQPAQTPPAQLPVGDPPPATTREDEDGSGSDEDEPTEPNDEELEPTDPKGVSPESPPQSAEQSEQDGPQDYEAWLARGLLLAHEKQLLLADLVGESTWELDMVARTLGFGSGQSWMAEIVGTESEASKTFLWSWANSASGIPAHMLTHAEQIRALGEKHGIPEFSEPQFAVRDGLDGMLLAYGISGNSRSVGALYRGPYDGGAALLLIVDPRFPRLEAPTTARVMRVITEGLGMAGLRHRATVEHYLDARGYVLTPTEAGFAADHENGSGLVLGFDDEDRLSSLTTTDSEETTSAE